MNIIRKLFLITLTILFLALACEAQTVLVYRSFNPNTGTCSDPANWIISQMNPAFTQGWYACSGGLYIAVTVTSGDISGGVSSTDKAIARYNGTSGKIIQNSAVTIADDGDINTTGNLMTVGDSTQTQAGRYELRTQSTDIHALNSQTFNFTNGPVGQENYKDNQLYLGYNSATNGGKINSGLVNYGYSTESKFTNGASFQTEEYFTWTNPAGNVTIRPRGFVINHTSNAVIHNLNGQVWFFRDSPNQATQTAFWAENGFLEFLLSTAAVVMPNNVAGYTSKNLAGNNNIPLIWADNTDTIRIGSGGQNAIVGSQVSTFGDLNGRINIGRANSRTDANTYIDFPGLDWIRLYSGGNQRIKVEPDGTNITGNMYCVTDGGCTLGKASGVNFRFDVVARSLEVGTGIVANGGGLKHIRTGTGSITNGTSAAVTVTWGTAFADANYTATCSVVDSTAATASLRIVHIQSFVAGSMVVRVENTAASPLSGTLTCIAIHD